MDAGEGLVKFVFVPHSSRWPRGYRRPSCRAWRKRVSSRRTWAIEAVGRPLVEDEGVVNGLGHPLFRDDVFVIRIQTAS